MSAVDNELEELARLVSELEGGRSDAVVLYLMHERLERARPALPFDLEPDLIGPQPVSISEFARQNTLRCRYDAVRLWHSVIGRLNALLANAATE